MDESSEVSMDITRSPFHSIIGTNCVPSQVERASLKEFLVAPQLEKSRLEAELSRVKAHLKSTEEYIHAHQMLLSPIRKLPPETLAEIFMHCVLAADSVRSLQEAPLLLTIICRDWRRVAIDTPLLWQSLHFYLPPHLNQDALSQRLAGISLWLERSGSLPLSISFHGRTTYNSPLVGDFDEHQTKKNMESCIRTLMRFADRIATLSLSLPLPDFALFDELSPPNFPALIYLRLRDANLHEGSYGHLSETPAIAFLPSLLGRMPVLSTLKVHEFHLRRNAAVSFGLGSLTTIDLTTGGITTFGVLLTTNEGLALLAQTPLVQSVKITIHLGNSNNNPNDTSPPAPTEVHLNQLVEMRLVFIRVSRILELPSDMQTHMTLFFDSIQCPLLNSFSVSWQGLLITQLPFRALPLHRLDTLDLDISMDSTTLLECLSLVSNIKSLRFNATSGRGGPGNAMITCSFEESHLLGLTQSSKDVVPLCPRLQKLQLIIKTTDGGLNVNTTALINLIQSRRTTLTYCDLFFRNRPPFTSEQLTSLRKLKDDGLNLRLHCAKPFLPPNLDPPTMGLPDLPYMPVHQRSLLHRMYTIPDGMEGPYGTEVII
ncbi:MAG: hypothetical protein NXY57DRAFT_464558 [Lentinula lateritia]|nr:MAG: hypothetical protein NXY57DRAFT_464558 [Lentinula lateritia]